MPHEHRGVRERLRYSYASLPLPHREGDWGLRAFSGSGKGDGMEAGGFRAGVGRVEITPPLSAPHASWGAQVHVLPDGAEAALWATVLVVTDSGGETAAFADLDLVIVSREESDAIRVAVAHAVSIAPTAVRLSVTHNHAGPPPSAWDWAAEGGDALRGYYAQLSAYVAGAARLAVRGLRPARIGVGAGASRVARNRRETAPDGRTVTGVDPVGPIEPLVQVTRIDDRAGEPVAAIVGYTMHPTALGPSNRLVSPDWPGHMKRAVETLTGAPCLFAQGATGDIGPGEIGYTDDVRAVRRLGAAVGAEAARVWLETRLPTVTYRHSRIWESGAPLGVWEAVPDEGPEPAVRTLACEVPLPVAALPPLAEAEADVRDAVGHLDALVRRGAPAAEVEAATFVAKRANMTLFRVRTFGGRETFPVALHLLRIGPAVFAGAECEPFHEIGTAIRARSPFPHTWFGGYTGGWFGYVPTPEEYPRGGYEVYTSPYTPDAAAALVEGTVAALNELASLP